MAGQRGVTSPNASTPARFRGWEVVLAGGGLSDPRNEHSCSFRGCVVLEAGRRWVEPRRRAVVLGFRGRGTVVAAREEPDPRNEQRLLVAGRCGTGGRQKAGGTPETSSRARRRGSGDGGGGGQMSESRKRAECARFRGWEAGG